MTGKAQIIKSILLKGGISIANQSWDYKIKSLTVETNKRTGSYSALAFEFIRWKHISLTTEIGYCEKGHKQDIVVTTINFPEGIEKETYNTRFSYFQVAPLLRGGYEVENLLLFGILGLRMDYHLSYQSDFDLTPIEKDFNKSIYGLTAGGGVEYKLKNVGIQLEFQYQYDFNEALVVSENSTYSGLEIKNQAILISLGGRYYFHKKREK